MPNRLIDETSPYLLQHAHNPVDWYPWGPEALELARAEDKPILLSVGYSACHWCHVMERESFEDPAIAAQMNQGFVCIKVDREERPDIDSIFMTAVQALSGQGGWPMTVFLTPDCKPYYGGTYFPPDDRHGMPGFPRVLAAMSQAYRERRGDVIKATTQLVNRMRQLTQSVRSLDPLTEEVLRQAYMGIAGQVDDRFGGVGSQPKFPQPMTFEFLLRHHVRTGDPQALELVELTLDSMAHGGIYDHVGGGFHRYSTDAFWLVPHFVKMLYDNALLAKLYLHAYQVTGSPLYRRVVEETLDYVLREMTGPEGGFYSAQDADSEGVEGKFYVWTPEELIDALGEGDARLFAACYGVTPEGNFEGSNILHLAVNPAAVASRAGVSEEAFDEFLRGAKAHALEARSQRVAPGLDDKVLTSWNGLTMRALAEAAGVLDRPDYAEAAARNADFVLRSLRRDGRLLRTYRRDPATGEGRAKLNGYLEDYSFLIDGLIALHEVTLEQRWLQAAIELGHDMVELFWEEASGQFYDTGTDHEELIVRPSDSSDNAAPCGSSMAADVLLRLAVITGDGDLERRAVTALRSARELMARFPTAAGHWLCALDFYLSTPKEIAILGGAQDADTRALLARVYASALPNRVLVGGESDAVGIPLLQDRQRINGRATAYVCRNYVCNLPVNEPGELARQLAE